MERRSNHNGSYKRGGPPVTETSALDRSAHARRSGFISEGASTVRTCDLISRGARNHSLQFILRDMKTRNGTPQADELTGHSHRSRSHVATTSADSVMSSTGSSLLWPRIRPHRKVSAVVAHAEAVDSHAVPSTPSSKLARRTRRAAADPRATTTMSAEDKRKSRQCKTDGCGNYTIDKGLCFRHGGGKKCKMPSCNASRKVNGVCWKHGGSVQCTVIGCDRRAKSRGLCWHHGGGTLCEEDDCKKVAVSNGRCWAHGGGKRCLYEGCERPAYERTLNYCPTHFERYEKGEEVLEL